MDTLLEELWPSIINGDWRVYAGLLAIPRFARLAMKDPTRWKKMLTVEDRRKGYIRWTLAGQIHRDDDLPAIIYAGGSQHWYQHGKRHREGDLPAVIETDGSLHWYRHGKRHREDDLPMIIYADGSHWWYRNGTFFKKS